MNMNQNIQLDAVLSLVFAIIATAVIVFCLNDIKKDAEMKPYDKVIVEIEDGKKIELQIEEVKINDNIIKFNYQGKTYRTSINNCILIDEANEE